MQTLHTLELVAKDTSGHKQFKMKSNSQDSTRLNNFSIANLMARTTHLKQADSSDGRELESNLLNGECSLLSSITCHLESTELWSKFHELGTEMIITKTGRRMFPTIRCSFSGFQDFPIHQKLAIVLDVIPCDNKRYRYAYHRSCWLVAGKADPAPPKRQYLHPDSPFSVKQLHQQRLNVSFEKVKLTNNEADKTGQIILNSMHKFQPRIHLVLVDDSWKPNVGFDLDSNRCKTFVFDLTSFTAVTAYQNQLITKLKIDSNPFAKGFRDSSRLSEIESYRESMGNTVFHTDRRRKSEDSVIIPCKKPKEERAAIEEDSNEEPSENVALSVAARLLSARAQLIHQQVLLQQQKSTELINQSSLFMQQHHQSVESQMKFSQIIQLAHLQAYLMSLASSSGATAQLENQSE